MIDVIFSYRGASICVVAPNDHDAIPAKIQEDGTFYEFDVLERCEFYMKRLLRTAGVIIDVGAYIGNHTVFFANFCCPERIIAFEPALESFEVLTQTIERNGLKNVRAYNLAVGATEDWGSVAICDPENLGANRVRRCNADQADAVQIVPLDTFLASTDSAEKPVSLMKIDVEGMECEVIKGAKNTIGRWKPILCIEVLDASHMGNILRCLRAFPYLIRECNGSAPTYLLTWESRIPKALIWAINLGWLLLAQIGRTYPTRWTYRRVIETALPIP